MKETQETQGKQAKTSPRKMFRVRWYDNPKSLPRKERKRYHGPYLWDKVYIRRKCAENKIMDDMIIERLFRENFLPPETIRKDGNFFHLIDAKGMYHATAEIIEIDGE